LSSSDLVPLAICGLIALVSFVWNFRVGLSWQGNLASVMLGPSFCFLAWAFYSWIRPSPILAEIALYFGLLIASPIFLARLTYLGASIDAPLRDALFARFDAYLGFNWPAWNDFINRHAGWLAIQEFAYRSHVWQPALSVVLFALTRTQGRNAELFTASYIAGIFTVAISATLPAIGPADIAGYSTKIGETIATIRSHAPVALEYVGITSFPSFHTTLGILYTFSHRDKWTLVPIAALNVVMLTAVPYCGDHYLIDVPAGALVALCSLLVTRALLRHVRHANPVRATALAQTTG
jgi:hypothetical protein